MQVDIPHNLHRAGLSKQDLKPREAQSLLELTDCSTRPSGHVDLHVSFGEGSNKSTISILFFVIPNERVYNDILKIVFLIALDAMASLLHLKIKYHNGSNKPIGMQPTYVRHT